MFSMNDACGGCAIADDCKYNVNKLYAVNELPCDCPDRCKYVDASALLFDSVMQQRFKPFEMFFLNFCKLSFVHGLITQTLVACRCNSK